MAAVQPVLRDGDRMRFLWTLIFVAACADRPAMSHDFGGSDLSASIATDSASALMADLSPLDGGGCIASTPPTTLYLDYCATEFCFHDYYDSMSFF